MQPRTVVDSVRTRDGRQLVLIRRGEDFLLELDREPLMSSRQSGSEEELARAVIERIGFLTAPRLLVGGLGMGFTVRAALDALGERPRAVVEVAEVFGAVVEWNRGPLAVLADAPLSDPRVRIRVEDVADTVARARGRYDAILLDVDNGPDAFTLDSNAGMYRPAGLDRLRAAIASHGVLGVWSAYDDRRFAGALERAGFDVEVRRVRARRGGGPRHVLFLARRRDGTAQPAARTSQRRGSRR